VSRASLEDTYMALVERAESGQSRSETPNGAAPKTSDMQA